MLKILKRKSRGQLFVIEAFIAVAVMIIMVTALYDLQIASQVPHEPSYAKEIYSVLQTLDKKGILENYVVALKNGDNNAINEYKNSISEGFHTVLPANGKFYLYCENVTSGIVVEESIINPTSSIPDEAEGINYMISNIAGNFEPYIFHVLVWLEGV